MRACRALRLQSAKAKLNRMKKWFGQLIGAFGAKSTPPEKAIGEVVPQAALTPPLIAFQPHNEIERLLIEAATNADARTAFQRALLAADLYAATPEAPKTADIRTVREGERLSLLNVQGPDGNAVTAVFTAQERIVEVFGVGAGFVGMNGELLLDLVASQGAWLNPGFPYGVYWTPDQLAALLGKPVPRTIQKDTQVLLGAPSDPPTALIASLKAALGRDSRIAEAWLALAHWPEEGKSSWYLDIRTVLEGAAVQELLADVFKVADYAGRPLDMLVNKPGGKAGIGIRVAPLQTH